MMRFQRLKAAVGVALLAAVGAANALTVYTFNSTAVGAFGPGPSFGEISLQAGTNGGDSGVTVTVTLAPGFNFVQTGGGAPEDFFFGFNLTAGTVKAGSISLINSLGDSLSSRSGASTAPGFSTYNTVILCADGKDCNNGASGGGYDDPLTFFVIGATEASFGSDFVADVYNGASTGWIGTTAPIPEPETYALMLAGLGAVGFMARRRKAAQKA